jgi:diphosphomevalonate decarboxylase
VVSQEHKPTGSTEGHRLAPTSPLQHARIEDAARRLDLCRKAILHRDFAALAEIAELDSNLMHAVMTTSNPRLIYYEPPTLLIIKSVTEWRKAGIPVFYTIDAGPNVHVITVSGELTAVAERLSALPDVVKVLVSPPGGAARMV